TKGREKPPASSNGVLTRENPNPVAPDRNPASSITSAPNPTSSRLSSAMALPPPHVATAGRPQPPSPSWTAGAAARRVPPMRSKSSPPRPPTIRTPISAGQSNSGELDPRIAPLPQEATPQASPQVTLLPAR